MTKLNFTRVKKSFYLIAVMLIIASCSEPSHIEEMKDVTTEMKTAADTTLIDGHYIVVVSKLPAVKNIKAAEMLQQVTGEISKQPGAKINRQYTNAITGFAAELTEEQVAKLRKDPRVEFIEQDSYVYTTSNLNVQEYVHWGLDRIDQQEGLLNRAYAYTADGTGVNVYVVDSGIRYSHNEFEGRASLGYDFVLDTDPENTDPNQEPGEDCRGHGTHVAGTIGGKTYGVAKNVNLFSVRVFGCSSGSAWSTIIAAVDWLTANAVHPAVVNMSLGGTNPVNQTAEAAFENSINSGIHYVAGAGNGNEDACNFFPALVQRAITVGASSIINQRANFSNYGECVDLYAPGVNIPSADFLDDNSFIEKSGTSMSTPHVTGVAALYLEKYPNATPEELHNAIVDNSAPNSITDVPSGTNNMLYSLWEPVEFTPPTPPNLNLSGTGEKIRNTNYANLTWNRTEAPYIKVYVNGYTNNVEHINDGEQQIRLGDRERDVTYMIKICEGGYSNCSEEIAVVFGNGSGGEISNESPVADFTYAVNLLSLQLTDSSTDSDGSVTAWTWNFGDGQTSSSQNPAYTYTAAGTYSVSLTVTDDAGGIGSTSQSITVSTEDPAPGSIVLSGTGYKVRGKWTTDLTWTPSGTSSQVDIYRNGNLLITTNNNGTFTDATNFNGSGSLNYKICESGTTVCSNEITVQF